MKRLTTLFMVMLLLFGTIGPAYARGTVELVSFPVCQPGTDIMLGGLEIRDKSETDLLTGECSFTVQLASWFPITSFTITDTNSVFCAVYSTVYSSTAEITLGTRVSNNPASLPIIWTANLSSAGNEDVIARISSQENPSPIDEMSLAVGRIYTPRSNHSISEDSFIVDGTVNISGTPTQIKIPTVNTVKEIEATTFYEGLASVVIDGEIVRMDVSPYIKHELLYVPVRFLARSLGITDEEITWDSETSTVVIKKSDTIVILSIGSKNMLVNGNTIILPVAPEIVDSRTMLPAEPIIEALKPGS